MGLVTDYEKLQAGQMLVERDGEIRKLIERIITYMNNFKAMATKYPVAADEIQTFLDFYKSKCQDIINAF